MNPYRDNAAPTSTPLTRWQRIGSWFCANGWHSVHEEILTGGAGPDDAAAALHCRRCDAIGWRWCDGSVTWN